MTEAAKQAVIKYLTESEAHVTSAMILATCFENDSMQSTDMYNILSRLSETVPGFTVSFNPYPQSREELIVYHIIRHRN